MFLSHFEAFLQVGDAEGSLGAPREQEPQEHSKG